MDVAKAQSLVEQLEDNIDDLEEILQPVIAQALSESTKKLPLLDKAKLHIVIVYAIESLIFSYLKLNNVDPKEHPVFRELTRVKQYFEKVKVVEAGPVQPRENLSLNKQAAARIIKHALASNDKLDLARLEKEAREKLLARRKLKDLEANMKEKAQSNDEESQSIEEALANQIAADIERQESVPRLTKFETDEENTETGKKEQKKRKRKEEDQSSKPSKSEEEIAAKKARKKAKKEAKKEAKAAAEAPS